MSAIEKITSNSDLPHNWKEIQLQELLDDFQNGFAFTSENYVENGIPIISMANISLDGKFQFDYSNAKKWEKESLDDLQSYIIEKGDVIIAMTDVTPTKNLIGRMAFVSSDGPFLLNQRVGLLRINKEKAERKFIYYVGNTKRWIKYCKSIATQGAQANISTKDIKKGLVLLPPKHEQQKIAEILSTVDEKIEVIEEKIAKTQELKKGLMQQLLTKGIGHNEFKDSPLGLLPKTWGTDLIENISDVTSSKRILQSDYIDSGVPFFRGKEITSKSNNEPLGDLVFISEDLFKSLKEKYGAPQEGDILVTAVGTIGMTYLVTKDDRFYFKDGNLIWLRNISKEVDRVFLKYFLQSESFQKEIRNVSSGSSQKALTIVKFKFLHIPMPSIEEQIKISSILTMVDEKLLLLKDKKTHFNIIKQGLMQNLLTGKIRVNKLLQKEATA